MPLIDITVRPGCRVTALGEGGENLRWIVRNELGPALPSLIIAKKSELRLSPETTKAAIQVKHHDHEPEDINVADLWVQVTFTEECPKDPKDWQRIRDHLYKILIKWFEEDAWVKLTCSFALDITWGTMHGIVMVNGGYIEY